jgi:hypothetical protein
MWSMFPLIIFIIFSPVYVFSFGEVCKDYYQGEKGKSMMCPIYCCGNEHSQYCCNDKSQRSSKEEIRELCESPIGYVGYDFCPSKEPKCCHFFSLNYCSSTCILSTLAYVLIGGTILSIVGCIGGIILCCWCCCGCSNRNQQVNPQPNVYPVGGYPTGIAVVQPYGGGVIQTNPIIEVNPTNPIQMQQLENKITF